MGHKVSAETRLKIGIGNSISLKGKKLSAEHIKNKSGWHHSEEAKLKISNSNKTSNKYTKERSRKIWETRRKNGNDKVSLETKIKLSISQKGIPRKNKNKI